MKNNFTKIILSLFLIFSIAGTLFSCDTVEVKETENDTEKESYIPHEIQYDKVKDYKLIERDGVKYMVFDDMTLYDGPNDRADLEFESLAEFKDTVITGKLTDWQKTVIATAFKKDDNGVRICDFNNLLEPHMPNECKIRAVYWSGSRIHLIYTHLRACLGLFSIFHKVYTMKCSIGILSIFSTIPLLK